MTPSPETKRKFVIADQNAISVEGHFQTYTNALALAAHRAGHEVIVLWNKRLPLDATAHVPYRPIPSFSYAEGEADAHGVLPYGEGHFGYELENAIRPLRLSARDVVVVHTCHFVELVELLDYFVSLPPAEDLPVFHVVLRYDPDIFRYRLGRLMAQLAALAGSELLREKFQFHSDTEQLAAEYRDLFDVQVGVCPIPVDLTRLLPKLGDALSRGVSKRPLVASYLGTARSEKGYRDLLEAIEFVAETYVASDRLHFVLQCSEPSLRSEPGLLEYQERLEARLRERRILSKVRLVKHIVDAEAYCDLVAQSDIVLLGYSAESYRSRSSSVLVEAMAAGKVVVTTEGSWMASRVGPDNAVCYAGGSELGPAIAQAVEHFDELAAGARARRDEAIAAADPAALAAYFAERRASAAAADAAPIVTIIADGDAVIGATSAVAVLRERLRTCDLAGSRVILLLLCGDGAGDEPERRRRFADWLRPHSLARVVIARGADLTRETGAELVSLVSACKPNFILLSLETDSAVVEKLATAGAPVVRDTGACSFTLAPSRLDALAGVVDCAELVTSARPLGERFGPEAARTKPLARLALLESVDLLLVAPQSRGGNEALRWFLEEVYRPFLAPRRASLIVIGEIDQDIPLPTFEDVFFIGPVEDRDPLYAAAKIIVAPTRVADTGSLELLEALSKRKPVVTTRVAAFAVGAAGVEAHDEPEAFAEAISALLDGREKRIAAAAASGAAAMQLRAARWNETSERLLAAIGGRAAVAAEETDARAEPLVEWSPAIRAANRFVRSHLAGEPLEGLDELALLPDGGAALVENIAASLLERRSAPILRKDGGLLARVTCIHRGVRSADIAAIVRIVAAGAGADAVQTIVVDRWFVGAIVARTSNGETIVHEFADDRRETTDLRLVDLPSLAEDGEWVAYRRIPLSWSERVLGRRILANWPPEPGEGATLAVFRSPPPPRVDWKARLIRLFAAIFSGRRSLLYKLSPWPKSNPLFDANWYFSRYEEVGSRNTALFDHYLRRGARDGRDPNPYFDTRWYLDRYPEVRRSGYNPLDHYLEVGAGEDYDPGPRFSGSRYLDGSPDVRAWRLNPLLHYLEYGRREGRAIYPAEPARPFQSIVAPAILAASGTPWVEIEIPVRERAAAPLLELYCGDRKLELHPCEADGKALLRAVLRRREVVSGAVHLRAMLGSGEAATIEICGLRIGWSSGPAEVALEQADRLLVTRASAADRSNAERLGNSPAVGGVPSAL
jgi:glycosyltransferase involved in cell wall biosynthesis